MKVRGTRATAVPLPAGHRTRYDYPLEPLGHDLAPAPHTTEQRCNMASPQDSLSVDKLPKSEHIMGTH